MHDLKQKLLKLGLNEKEATVYLLLLKTKNLTATEIAKAAGFSRPISYEIVKSLIEKEFCTKTEGNVRKFSAADPSLAIKRIQNDLESKKRLSENISDDLQKIYTQMSDNSSPLDYIHVLHTRSQIVHQAQKMELKVQHEVLSFSKPPYTAYSNNLENIQSINKEQFEAMQRGVVYKSLYEAPSEKHEDFLRVLNIFRNNGEDVRIAPKLPMKLLIFDYKNVIYMLENNTSPQTILTAVVVSHESLNEAMRITFNKCWEESETMEDYAKRLNITF
jgi:sugar-specific transcriptional regulator TrmB